MRVALFITCFNDLLFPDVGRAIVRLLRRLGHEVEFPAGPDLLRADESTPATATRRPAGRALRRRVRGLRRGGHAVRRRAPRWSATSTGRGRAGRDRATTGAAERVATVAPRVYELTEFLVDVLGVTDVAPRSRTP